MEQKVTTLEEYSALNGELLDIDASATSRNLIPSTRIGSDTYTSGLRNFQSGTCPVFAKPKVEYTEIDKGTKNCVLQDELSTRDILTYTTYILLWNILEKTKGSSLKVPEANG